MGPGNLPLAYITNKYFMKQSLGWRSLISRIRANYEHLRFWAGKLIVSYQTFIEQLYVIFEAN